MSMSVSSPSFDNKINGIVNYINSQNIVVLYSKGIYKVFHSIVFNNDTAPNKVHSIYINCKAFSDFLENGLLEKKIKEQIRDVCEIKDKILLEALFNNGIPRSKRFYLSLV